MIEIDVQCRDDRVYRFSPGSTAVLMIDLQKEFFLEDEREHRGRMHAILPRVKMLLSTMRALGCLVVHTRESYQADLGDVSAYRQSLGYVGRPGPLGRFCIAGEPGQAFVDESRPLPGEPVIDKAGFSAFHESGLDALLRDRRIDHLVLCGVTTQACVHSTLRDAVDRGYWCLTVADCCAALEPGLHDAALDIIAGEGHLFGWVADLEDLAAGCRAGREQA